MGLIRIINLSYFLVFLSSLCLQLGHATDTITAPNFINDSETIISDGGMFILGFFSPPNSTYRYVGIWYAKVSTIRAIWVANRNKPLKTTSGILTISEDGNLVVLDEEKKIIWSSNLTSSVSKLSARLLDNGNLVLQENTTGLITWESFQHPSDSWLVDMKLGTNATSGKNIQLTSWKSSSDPAIGTFSLGTFSFNLPEIYIWNGSSPYWRTGPWNGMIFIGVPASTARYQNGVKRLQDQLEGSLYFAYEFSNKSGLLHYVLNAEGNVLETYSINGKDLVVSWSSLTSECDVYGKCGAFGSCNPKNKPICSCLNGFLPKNIEEWNREDWISGCVRRTPLQCLRVSTGGKVGKKDGFIKLEKIKTPSLANWSTAVADECRYQCLEDCSCLAYAYENGIGCMYWTREFIDLQKFSVGGTNLYVRVANSELDNMNQDKLQELPIFNLEELASATNNFHQSNKLGQGGFGPVYKGKLLDGQEIAVKRLGKSSGQGLEEFMNEVIVISKLQHRNLVRLLGGCVEGEEKLLVYEYMPNKSLDAFLFDPTKQEQLDWKKRFNIIEGIGRGLLYLHRDSRLKIIHRDIKASNILLDEELNPKISDFGMARIFGGNEDQANTKRIVGTYGYMSPEYAMGGRFSEKSDVFSFGVLLLEIVSGRKNTHFYHDEEAMSLLGLAWKLWNMDNLLALVDPKIARFGFEKEIFRCIHVGLLCIQEFAKDRPSMSVVISMLKSEIVDLPYPRQPAFCANQITLGNGFSYPNQRVYSSNNVTNTMVQGR